MIKLIRIFDVANHAKDLLLDGWLKVHMIRKEKTKKKTGMDERERKSYASFNWLILDWFRKYVAAGIMLIT